jgi:phytoene synthase
VLRHSAIIGACEQLSGLAARRFEEAASLSAVCDRRQIRPAVIMMEVYRRTLERLNGRGWGRWAEPVSVSSAEKLWVALRYGMI